jgi:alkylation response protein AidB-like acyl-CoA dehydrogenase
MRGRFWVIWLLLRLLGISKPEAYGGLGLNYSYQVIFAEEFGRSRSSSCWVSCSGNPTILL